MTVLQTWKILASLGSASAVVESERIFTLVEACVSVASVTLSEKELKLVHMRRDDPR